jgi:hypothetical protein
MITVSSKTEPLTLDTLNALLANFATGAISLDEVWGKIDECLDVEQFEQISPPAFPESLGNRLSGIDAEAGI